MKLPSLKSRKVTHASMDLVEQVFRDLAFDLDLHNEPEVQKAVGLLANGKYLSFVQLVDSWTTQLYTSSREHFRWNQLACLLKKYPFIDPSIDREAAAMEKFMAAEHRCKRMNSFFRGLKARPEDSRYALLERMRGWILEC